MLDGCEHWYGVDGFADETWLVDSETYNQDVLRTGRLKQDYAYVFEYCPQCGQKLVLEKE